MGFSSLGPYFSLSHPYWCVILQTRKTWAGLIYCILNKDSLKRILSSINLHLYLCTQKAALCTFAFHELHYINQPDITCIPNFEHKLFKTGHYIIFINQFLIKGNPHGLSL